MGKKPMFYRIVFRCVRRIMRDTDFDIQFVRQLPQIFLEDIVTGVIAPSAVAEQQHGIRFRIFGFSVLRPPPANTGASELGGVMTCSQRNVADIAVYIIQAVRNGFSVRERRKIMIMHNNRFCRVKFSGPVKITDQFFFFTSILMTGLPAARYSSLRRSIFLNCSSRSGIFFFPASALNARRGRKLCFSSS